MRFRSAAVSCLALLVLAAMATDALAVNRCEDRNGRVTYTDEPCPAGARAARKVDDSPPVLVREASPAPAEAKDTSAKEAREPAKDEPAKGEAAPPKAVSRIEPARVPARATPEQQIQQLDEQFARQRRECADLSRQVDYARADLDAATSSQRASAELALRRLQEQFKAQCPRR